MKNFQKRILGVGLACTSLIGMAFIQLPANSRAVLAYLNLGDNTSESGPKKVRIIGPEKEVGEKASPTKTTLKGRVQTISNEVIGLMTNVDGQTVQLIWNSPEHHVSKKFIIQRSRDLERFYDIADIKPTKNDGLHSFVDEAPASGFVNYYRVIEFDADRNMHVYSPAAAEVNALNGELLGVTLHSSEEGEMVRVRMDNIKESDVLLSTISGLGVSCDAIQKNTNEVILLPSYPLSPGEYIVKVRDRIEERRFKVLVKKAEKMF